jgi:HEAT repeat protein
LRSGRAHALIRAHAVESLGKLGLPRSAEVLTEALTDPYRLVRSYAAGATEGRSGRAPPPVAHA